MSIPNQISHREAYRQQLAEGKVQKNPGRGHGQNQPFQAPPKPLKRPRAAAQVDGHRPSLAEQLGLLPKVNPAKMPALAHVGKTKLPPATRPATEPAPAAPQEETQPLPAFETLRAAEPTMEVDPFTAQEDLTKQAVAEQEELPPVGETFAPVTQAEEIQEPSVIESTTEVVNEEPAVDLNVDADEDDEPEEDTLI